MLFEELVEKHGVHLVVAHAVRFAFFVAHYQVRIYLFHIFGHQTELRYPGRITFLFCTETSPA